MGETVTQPSDRAIVKSAHDETSRLLLAAEHDIAKLLAPYGMSADRFRTTLLECLRANPSLLKCSPLSILRAAYHAAQVGLELGGPLGDAYLVPYKGNAKCIPGYRGLVHIATEADPEIDHFDADCVYEADEYTEERGDNPVFRVVPARFSDRGARIGVYAIVYWRPTAHGPRRPLGTVMRASEVEAIKKEALSKLQAWQVESSPWTKHEDEMWKKTALRRLTKMMNLRSARYRYAAELEAPEPMRADVPSRNDDLKAKLGNAPPVLDAEFAEENGHG